MANLERFTQAFWDRRYATHDHLWSGRPNAQLVACGQELTPGRALDVGCGEGGDAIWLAEQGWQVTGIDVSPVGLAHAAANAEQRGVSERISWRPGDLFGEDWELPAAYDLVSSQYLHLHPSVRDRAVQRLGAAVAPGGELLLVSHHPADLEIPGLRPSEPEMFYTAQELAQSLEDEEWEIVVAAAVPRDGRDREGRTVRVTDTVLRVRRASFNLTRKGSADD